MTYVQKRVAFGLAIAFAVVALAITFLAMSTPATRAAEPTQSELTGPALVDSLGLKAVRGEECKDGEAFTVPPWKAGDGTGFCLSATLSDVDSVGLAMRINGDADVQDDAELVVLQHDLVDARNAGDDARVAELAAQIQALAPGTETDS